MVQLSIERLNSEYNSGRYSDAWATYRALEATDQCTAEAHQRGARTALRLGLVHSAHHAILQVLDAGSDPELMAVIRCTYGLVLREMGRIPEAITAFEEFLQAAATNERLQTEYSPYVHYNLALALRQAGAYSNSIKHYQAACAAFREQCQPANLCQALLNLGWVACLNGEPTTAATALDEAEPLCGNADLRWQHRIGTAFLRAVSTDCDLTQVMKQCEAIITSDDETMPLRVRSHAYWLTGRIALAMDLHDTAHALAEQALWYGAVAGGESRCLDDAAALLQEIGKALAPAPIQL